MKTAIILAAGQGTRMKSALPKVLHPICGRPMIGWMVQAALDAGANDAIVVVGYGREHVEQYLSKAFGERVRTAVQEEQKGTGHAVLCALPALSDDTRVALILNGDGPLLHASDLRRLDGAPTQLAMLTCMVDDPTGYGRITRKEGRVNAIVEHRDCNAEQLAINEINPGIYAAEVVFLRAALGKLQPNNDQGELYLTDIVGHAVDAGGISDHAADAATLVGVNDRAQLAAVEDVMYERIADDLRRAGATIRVGARIDHGVVVAPDARIEHGVVLRGDTHIARGAVVDVGCVLDDVRVDDEAYLRPYSVCAASTIGKSAQVGPFAHMRRDSHLDERAKIGNFVETKNTRFGKGAKASHLSYLGDGIIGDGANIGAGTIFCNYDGFQKHVTTIEAGVFVGSDSQIVAPITIGEGAYIATGTTVTKDVPADALAISRMKQENKEGYASRLKRRMAAAAQKAKDQKAQDQKAQDQKAQDQKAKDQA